MKTEVLSKIPHPGATKPTTHHFVMRCNPLNSVEWETLQDWRKVGIFYAMGVPRYPPFLTNPTF